MKATFPGVVDKITTLKDGSLKITFVTQELTDADSAAVFQLRNKYGWCLFSGAEMQASDIPDEEPPELPGEKGSSKRLRDVLFVWWDQHGAKGDFNDFYRKQMEKYIDRIKETLD